MITVIWGGFGGHYLNCLILVQLWFFASKGYFGAHLVSKVEIQVLPLGKKLSFS